MRNLKEYLNESSENRRKFIKIVILVSLLLFIGIIAVLSFISLLPIEDELRIDNLPNLISDMPDKKRHSVYRTLYRMVDQYVETPPLSGGLIRKETLEHHNNGDTSNGHFIVDIESIRQSYEIHYEWSKKENEQDISSTSVTIDCISDKSLMIYDDFGCKPSNQYDSESKVSPYVFMTSYLPYTEKMSNGELLYIYLRTYLNTKNYFELSANDTCGNKALLDEVFERSQKFFASHDVKLEELDYKIRDLCNGGAH